MMNSGIFVNRVRDAMILGSGKHPQQRVRAVLLYQRDENPSGLEASGKGAHPLRVGRQTVLESIARRSFSPTLRREIGASVSEPCGLRTSRQAVQLGRSSQGSRYRTDLTRANGNVTCRGDSSTLWGERELERERHPRTVHRTATHANDRIRASGRSHWKVDRPS